jgi:23S rRNA pseudouridine955/2504/2580 synthase
MAKPLKSGEDYRRVQELSISSEEAGQRLDNYLFRVLPGVPKSRLYRAIRSGEVRINGARVRAPYRLEADDRVRIPPLKLTVPSRTPPPAHACQRLLGRIVYEDGCLLAVSKPAGMAAHGGSGVSHGVIELLRAARPDLRYLELVHRLDRDTSGILLLATRRSALRNLHEQLREGAVEKHYLALLAGRWSRGAVRIDLPLLTHERRGGERMVRVSPDGKPAASEFRPQRVYADASLMMIEIETGRTHQIRVHAAACGHPVLGDEKYGDAEINRRWRERGLARMFLHAQSLTFMHPANGAPTCLTAPLDPELVALLDRLDEDAQGN